MKPFALAPLLTGAVLLSNAANAQSFRAYLASYGVDTNPCTVAAPCRLLPAALNAVASGGEIWILDSANFNQSTVDIGKSVSIRAMPGETASFTAAGGAAALTITTAGLRIGLRNIVIAGNASNPGTDGIVMSMISVLTVEGCSFLNLPGRGVVVAPMAGGAATLNVIDSVFRGNGVAAILADAGTTAFVSRTQLVDNAANIVASASFAGNTTVVSVTDVNISGGGFGVRAYSGAPGANASAYVTRSTIHATSEGLSSLSGPAFGTTLVTVSNSTVSGNAAGYYQSGGTSVVKSLGNNYIDDNGGNTGALTPAALR